MTTNPISVQIPEIINTITDHCISNRLPELRALCFDLFEAPNDEKQAEHVISDGLVGYIKNYYSVIQFMLSELKNHKPNNLVPVFMNLVKYASTNNDINFITFLLNSQKTLMIENLTVIEAICMTENIPFIRDVVISLQRSGYKDITIGLQSAISAKLDNVIVFLFKMADDLQLIINYETCLQKAIDTNAYGIINLLLDRITELDSKAISRLLETPRNTGNLMMVDFFIQKCRDKRIKANQFPQQIE